MRTSRSFASTTYDVLTVADCPGLQCRRQQAAILLRRRPVDTIETVVVGTAASGDTAMDTAQSDKISSAGGFVAALDQSGGSTPKALAEYGVPEDRYSSEDEMFDLVHEMRTRVITSPAFTGDKILAVILFEQTMERQIEGMPTSQYLWETKRIVPILKVDKGLAEQANGVQLMKPITALDELLERANGHKIYGTKMRSVIHEADEQGVTAIVEQQFEYAAQIRAAGLVPIIEPEVSIKSESKQAAEQLLHDGIQKQLQQLPDDEFVMLKLTIPSQSDLYSDVAHDPHVQRVLALSGGYSRDEACELLAKNRDMTASFSRALLEGLAADQSDDEFNATLDESIKEIYAASVDKG
jgi:fructose-bisphosphate aldolase class I